MRVWILLLCLTTSSALATESVPVDCAKWAAQARANADKVVAGYPELAAAFGADYEQQAFELCQAMEAGDTFNPRKARGATEGPINSVGRAY